MLHLKTAAGERLEIPAGCIIAVMRPCDDINPSAIMYDMGAGAIMEQLSDQYGFVKKSVLDAAAMINPIEVKIVEKVTVGEGPEAATAMRQGRAIFARSRIVGRREILSDPSGIRACLFVNLQGSPLQINIADTLDELDGVEAEDAPISPPIPLPLTPEGA